MTGKALDLRTQLELRNAIRGCRLCPTIPNHNPVPYSGIPNRKRPVFAIIGEAPGKAEHEEGRPFVGKSGKFLHGELARLAKGERSDEPIDTTPTVFLNAVSCYPGTTPGTATIRKPTSKEQENCRQWLNRQLEVVRPDFVLCVGTTALNSFLKGQTITDVHGKWFRVSHYLPTSGTRLTRTTMLFTSTYHPSAVLREKGTSKLYNLFKKDLRMFYEAGWLVWMARHLEVEVTPSTYTDAGIQFLTGGLADVGGRRRLRRDAGQAQGDMFGDVTPD